MKDVEVICYNHLFCKPVMLLKNIDGKLSWQCPKCGREIIYMDYHINDGSC